MSRPAPVTLYFCPHFACWLSVNACTRIKLAERAPPSELRVRSEPGVEGPVFRTLREFGRRLSPCLTCPGVAELRARRETPAPRRIET